MDNEKDAPKQQWELDIERIWWLWENGYPGIDYPETFDPWNEVAKITAVAQALAILENIPDVCPECGLPRGDVRDGRCMTCMSDNFMDPL